MTKNNVYSAFNRPITEPSFPGEHTYTWEYLNESGEIVKQTKNVFEEIQSYESSCDYMHLIEMGFDPNQEEKGFYGDISNFDGYRTDINDYIASLVANLQSAIQENAKHSETSGKIVQQGNEDSDETTKTEPTKSTDGGDK